MVEDPLLEQQSEFIQWDVAVKDEVEKDAEFGASVDGFQREIDPFAPEYSSQVRPEDPGNDFHKRAENEGRYYEADEEWERDADYY